MVGVRFHSLNSPAPSPANNNIGQHDMQINQKHNQDQEYLVGLNMEGG